MAVSMLSGETKNFLEYSKDNNGDIIDPDTYDDVIIYLFWQMTNELAASYSMSGNIGTTITKKIGTDKLEFTLLPVATQDKVGNLDIQVNIVDNGDEVVKKKTTLARVLKAY